MEQPTSAGLDVWAVLAGSLALTSVGLSMYEIMQHLRNFTKPYLQRYIIRIMLMVPIYSLNAWFAMIVPGTGLYLDAIREAYESFVIYSFMKYLLNFLNYDTNLQQYIDHKPGPAHIAPLCCLPNCIGGRQFLTRCKHGILQYVVIRPITTLIAFTSQQFGIYGEGNFNPISGFTYPVLLLINNASQVLAMYCLVIFYTGYRQELRPMRPLAKFLSIKLVVFFSFFQSVVISGLLEIPKVEEILGDIFPAGQGSPQRKLAIGRQVQELLICFDMLIASVGHLFAFTHKPYTEPDYTRSARLITRDGDLTVDPEHAADGGVDKSGCCGALCNILDFSEDRSDLSEHFGQIYDKCREVFSFQPGLPTIVSSQQEVNQVGQVAGGSGQQRARREKRRSRTKPATSVGQGRDQSDSGPLLVEAGGADDSVQLHQSQSSQSAAEDRSGEMQATVKDQQQTSSNRKNYQSID